MRSLPGCGARLDQGGSLRRNGAGRVWVSRHMGKSPPVDQHGGCGEDQEESWNQIGHRTSRAVRWADSLATLPAVDVHQHDTRRRLDEDFHPCYSTGTVFSGHCTSVS